MPGQTNSTSAPLQRLRAGLAVIYVVSALGVIVELILTRHNEDFWQKVPIVLSAAGIVALILAAISRARILFWLLQLVLVVQLLSSVVGGYFHHKAREEFQLEAYPDLAGWDLFKEAFVQRNPPPLASGAMALTAMVGLAWSYRHPSGARKAAVTNADVERSSNVTS